MKLDNDAELNKYVAISDAFIAGQRWGEHMEGEPIQPARHLALDVLITLAIGAGFVAVLMMLPVVVQWWLPQ